MTRLALAALALLLLVPASAHAGGTVSVQGDTLVFSGTPDDDAAVIYFLAGSGELGAQPRTGGGTGPTAAGPGCRTEGAPGSGGQTRVVCAAAGVTKVAVDTGAGDDFVTITLDEDRWAPSVEMGDGKDRFTSTSGGGRVDLGAGDDRIVAGSADTRVDGGAGDDLISLQGGDDVIDGGAGDDEILAAGGDDRITGGRGEDDIDAGSGKDDIRVRDRERDDVSCGSKRDKVVADRSDDLNRCETVRTR
jgi:Ca2+-binding RTX toxin-like protein